MTFDVDSLSINKVVSMKEGKTDMTDVIQKRIWALPSHFQDMAGGIFYCIQELYLKTHLTFLSLMGHPVLQMSHSLVALHETTVAFWRHSCVLLSITFAANPL